MATSIDMRNLIHRVPSGSVVNFYVNKSVVVLFENSMKRKWDKLLMIALLHTQNTFQPGFVTGEMMRNENKWSEPSLAMYSGQEMWWITYPCDDKAPSRVESESDPPGEHENNPKKWWRFWK